MSTALVGVIGGIVICLLGLLITIVMGLKAELADRNKTLFGKVDDITARLTHMVLVENYNQDKKEITLKLDEHGDRILTLEIRVKGVQNA